MENINYKFSIHMANYSKWNVIDAIILYMSKHNTPFFSGFRMTLQNNFLSSLMMLTSQLVKSDQYNTSYIANFNFREVKQNKDKILLKSFVR